MRRRPPPRAMRGFGHRPPPPPRPGFGRRPPPPPPMFGPRRYRRRGCGCLPFVLGALGAVALLAVQLV